ncbi:MAG TPA: hypothetical protein P5556_10095 [Candidatus Gastranaerophilales bacterium]|nr:hypothetical protein [Candidatus Gastranaerophilales bacterium]
MSKIDFKTYLNGVGNDLKIAIDDVIGVVEKIHDDVEKLKLDSLKPNKLSAKILLDYISWKEGQSKQNLEKLCGKEIEQYQKWLEYYSYLS